MIKFGDFLFNADDTVKSMDNAKWGFEEHQYDSTPSTSGVGRDPNHISHFLWCKDASNSVRLQYDSSWNEADVYLFTNSDATTPSSSFAVNGKQGFWRALSGGENGEWNYLFNMDNKFGQTVRSGKYRAGVTVCDHANCLILLPDEWMWGENGVGNDWLSEYSESTNVKWSTYGGRRCCLYSACRL
ncbi:MAG: hypothetical protein KBT41_03510 [bacterium]|nr:hypothetical protein [Candidatus Colousia faecequi]